MSFFGVKFTGH